MPEVFLMTATAPVVPAPLRMVRLLHQKASRSHRSCMFCHEPEASWEPGEECANRVHARTSQLRALRFGAEMRLHTLLNEVARELHRNGFRGGLRCTLQVTTEEPDARRVDDAVFVGTVGAEFEVVRD